MSFPIDTTIPVANNDPADDQPLMQENFENIYNNLSVDHIAPGATNNGKHAQVQLKAASPTTFISGFGNVYSNTANGASQLFYSPDNSANAYQLTRTNVANFSKFATNTTYTTNHTGGWTFLPGGMLLQYGRRSSSLTSGTVTFPVAFTNAPYSVTVTPNTNNASTSVNVSTSGGGPTTSSFDYNASTNTSFYWYAIGV